MRAAVKTSEASPTDAEALTNYFETAATSLINQPLSSAPLHEAGR